MDPNGIQSVLKPLVGTDTTTLDDKGRILVVKSIRDRLGANFTLTIGTLECIVAYPAQVWDRIYRKIFSHEEINEGTSDYTRLVLGSAVDDLNCDRQGRLLIPSHHRTTANLKKSVTMVGCGNRLEIWSSEEFATYTKLGAEYKPEVRARYRSAFKEMKGIQA